MAASLVAIIPDDDGRSFYSSVIAIAHPSSARSPLLHPCLPACLLLLQSYAAAVSDSALIALSAAPFSGSGHSGLQGKRLPRPTRQRTGRRNPHCDPHFGPAIVTQGEGRGGERSERGGLLSMSTSTSAFALVTGMVKVSWSEILPV